MGQWQSMARAKLAMNSISLFVASNKLEKRRNNMSIHTRPAAAQPSTTVTGSDDVSSIEEIPLEVLYRIFSLSVNENMDIGLFLTSKQMAQKLANHPTIRAVRNFLTADELLILYPEGAKIRDGASKAAMGFLQKERCSNRESGVKQLLSTAWCNDAFIRRTQLAVIKRLLATYWDPLLARDGYATSRISHAYLWQELEVVVKDKILPTADVELVSQPGPIEGRWRWTNIVIWPSSGRIVVRDRLYNRRSEICCPVLRTFLALQKLQTVV